MGAETLTEIFRDNAHLCSKVTESEVQHFIHCIEKKRHIAFLHFLQTVVQGSKGPQLKRTQDMVMNEVHMYMNNHVYRTPFSYIERKKEVAKSKERRKEIHNFINY